MDMLTETKIKLQKKLSDTGLYDVRLIGLAMIAFVAISVFWSGAKIIQQNYELSLKVQEIERENQIIQLENRTKELQNAYLQTDTFAELTARRVNGKAAEGERAYIVPTDVALAALTEETTQEALVETPSKPQYQRNLEAWVGVYFGQ